jgi:uncharacterized protein YifN (PemK superfamily)
MPLLYQPRPGQVVMCDFKGYVVPEMVKVRPVVVVARNRKNRWLVTVVRYRQRLLTLSKITTTN